MVALAVLVAALGYFVDIFDLVVFGVVRKASLLDIGVPEHEVESIGRVLFNLQMGGLLIGGILFGVLGDRRGRLSVLFGSILTYSVANLANAWVDSVGAYGFWRFVAGVGLAGELGAGITLVAELMHKDRRGLGTTIVAAVGLLGATAAGLLGERFHWRTTYAIGGSLGLALLFLRLGVAESGMFRGLQARSVRRGDFLSLFTRRERLLPYLGVIATGVPIWFVVGLIVFFTPELAAALGMQDAPSAGDAIFWCYAGLSAGDLLSGLLSQAWKSRKKAVMAFLCITCAAVAATFTVGRTSSSAYEACCFALGLGTGYWAVFVTMAAEQFGTNLRATVATTAPNFVRGSVVPLTFAFDGLLCIMGRVEALTVLAALVIGVAFAVLLRLRETYGRDLDFVT